MSIVSLWVLIDYDSYLNYGAIGKMMGHALTHAFDAMGRQFDEAGNNNEWWSKATEARYNQTTRCLIDEYGKFPLDGDVKVSEP